MKSISLIIFASCMGLIISGCSQKTTEEYIAGAKVSIEQGKTEDATLALKNAIAGDSNNNQARLLLGELYLNSGQFANAEKELGLVFKTRYSFDSVAPLLVKALFNNENYHKLLNTSFDFEQLSPSSQAAVLYYKALALFAQGKTDLSKQTLMELETKQLDKKYTALGSIVAKTHTNEAIAALDEVNKLLNDYPDLTEALLLQAHLASALHQAEDAKASLKKYLKVAPFDLKSRLFYASILVGLGDSEEANKQVNSLLNVAPEQAYLNQLKAMLEMRASHFENAKLYADKAIQNGSSNIISRIVAGVSAYNLGNSEQAYDNLSIVVNDLPKGHAVRKLFAILQFDLGYSQDAMDSLESLKNNSNVDPALFIESSALLFKQGKLSHASDVLKMVEEDKISGPEDLTKLGVLKLALNDKSGISDFEKVLAEEPEFEQAIRPLALAYLKDGRVDDALALAKSMIKSKPDSVQGYNLAGYVLSKGSRDQEASEYYDKALAIDGQNIESFLYSARQAIEQENYQEALDIYKKIIQFKPVHLPAVNTYFQLEGKYGDVNQALVTLKSVYEDASDNLNLALFYGKILETVEKYDDALLVIRKIPVSSGLPEVYWTLYVDILTSLNKSEAVEDKLQEWIRTAPTNVLAWRTVATYHERNGDIDVALNDVRRGIQTIVSASKDINVDNLRVLEAQYLLNLKDVAKAQVVIDELRKVHKGNHVIQLLDGQVDMLAKNYASATPKLQANYAASPSSTTMELILKSLVADNKKSEALSFVRQHLQTFPSDIQARMYLANLLTADAPSEAEAEYKVILKRDKNNVFALNNLASLLNARGAGQEALSYSTQAFNLAPKVLAVLNTYSKSLQNTGQKSEAVKVLYNAYTESGKDASIAPYYIEALQEADLAELAEQVKVEAGL